MAEIPGPPNREGRSEARGEVRSGKVTTFLRQYLVDPRRRTTLLESKATSTSLDAPEDVAIGIRTNLFFMSQPEQVQLVNTLIRGQADSTLLPEVDESQRASRALLPHVVHAGGINIREQAVNTYKETVASLGDDTSLDTLEALEETASSLLDTYKKSSKVRPDEVQLGRAAWEVTQRVDRAKEDVLQADREQERDPVEERRSVVSRLSQMGFRRGLIGHVTGYSNLDVSSDLSYLKRAALQQTQETPGEIVYDPEAGIQPPDEPIAPTTSILDAVGGEAGLEGPSELGIELPGEKDTRRLVHTTPEERVNRVQYIRDELSAGRTIDEIARSLRIATQTVRDYLDEASTSEQRMDPPDRNDGPDTAPLATSGSTARAFVKEDSATSIDPEQDEVLEFGRGADDYYETPEVPAPKVPIPEGQSSIVFDDGEAYDEYTHDGPELDEPDTDRYR